MTGVLNSSGTIGPVGSYYVFGVTAIPLPSPCPSALSLSPATLNFSQNVGTTSASQSVTVVNLGGSPLDLSSIAATGTVTGQLTLTDNSGNLGRRNRSR